VRALAVLVMIAALVAVSASSAKPKVLKGTTGPGFSIKLKTAAGKPVKTLKAGSYSITVSDRSGSHMFHLIGPGVNKVLTSLGFMGTKTTLVKLKPGKYIYQCNPHKNDGMKASFMVTG
jgi:plastocyanin